MNRVPAPVPAQAARLAPVYVHPRSVQAHVRAQARARAQAQALADARRQARFTLAAHVVWASTLVIAVAGALAATPASAQSAASVEERFSAWDRDRNDLMSLDEYRAEARAQFDAMDDDANGNVSAQEMEEADPQSDGEMSTAQKIALQDSNEDGVLSLAEHEDAVEKRFDEIDANDDDNVGRDELKSPWMLAKPTSTYP